MVRFAIVCIGPEALGAGPLNALAGTGSTPCPTGGSPGSSPGRSGRALRERRHPHRRDSPCRDLRRRPAARPAARPASIWTGGRVSPPRFARLSDMLLAGFAPAEGLAPLRFDPARRAPLPRESPLIERARPAIAALSKPGLGTASRDKAAFTRGPIDTVARARPGAYPLGRRFPGRDDDRALDVGPRRKAAAALAATGAGRRPAMRTNRISGAHLRARRRAGWAPMRCTARIDALAREGSPEALARGAARGSMPSATPRGGMRWRARCRR